MAEQDDPADWSVDRVVREICCTKPPPWTLGAEFKPIINPEATEKALRDNDIDGDNLLALKDKNLRDDLGFSSFGQRRVIRNFIKILRQLSPKYQSEHPPQTSSHASTRPFTTPQLSHTPFTSTVRSPSHASFNIKQSIENGIVSDRVGPAQVDAKQKGDDTTADNALSWSNQNPANQNGSILNVLSTMIDEELDDNDHAIALDRSDRETNPTSTQPPGQGRKGLKRAKLITVPDRATANVDPRFSIADADTIMTDTNHDGPFTNTRDSRDVSPPEYEYQPSKRLKMSEQSPVFRDSSSACQPRVKADTIVRHKLNLSSLSTRQAGKDESDHSDNEEHSSNFFISAGSADSHKLSRIARQSKRQMIAKQFRSKATSIAQGLGDVEVPVQKPSRLSETPSDLPEYLQRVLRKYPADDSGEPMPFYGDSEDEDKMMTPEYETPPPDDALQVKQALSKQEVDGIIDSVFEKFRSDWRGRGLPKAQTKAHAKWMTAAKNKRMHSRLLRDSKLWQARTQKRLGDHRQGIHVSEWRKAEDVEQQCLAIEFSVHQLEEFNLYVQVLEDENEPALPAPKIRTTSRTPQPSRARRVWANGDEELASDSDNDDFFVVEDTDAALPNRELMELDRSDDTWNPKFSAKINTQTQVSGDSGGNQSETAKTVPRNHQAAVIDLGDTSDDNAQSPSGDGNKERNQAATEATGRNPLKVPHSSGSSDVDPDFERGSRLPSAKHRKLGKSEAKTIDLTGSSPGPLSDGDGHGNDHFDIRTPDFTAIDSPDQSGSRQMKETHSSVRSGIKRKPSGVEETTMQYITRVRKLPWHEIEPRGDADAPDCQLALAKCVFSMLPYRVDRLLDYARSFKNMEDFAEVCQDGLQACKDDEDEIEHVDRKNQSNARLLTELLLSYATGRSFVDSDDIVEADIEEAHAVVIGEDFAVFRDTLLKLLQNMVDVKSTDPSKNNGLAETTDYDIEMLDARDDSNLPSPFKIRKRKVTQSQAAILQQRADQNRVERQEAKRAALAKEQAAMGIDKDTVAVTVNTGAPFVHLDRKLAAKVKPHQMEGIQFIWREIVESSKRTGCLLAHTMGLGKTMQIIAVLVTLAQVKKSQDEFVRKLIPKHLVGNKTLILCPMALVESWEDELDKWMPLGPRGESPLGDILTVTNKVRTPAATIERWIKRGGILILSYERFRSYTNPTFKSKILRESPEVRAMLLEGPDIVVADEAHKMKNATSKLTQSAKELTTHARIALTGSPLNNYLEEYHTMVDWIAPGYLGSALQFKSKYVEPINRGLFSDSSTWERKASLKKLHVLKKNIAAKIHRADITAIANEMPSKTEFFITVPLTQDQEKAYRLYVEDLRGAATAGAKKTTNAAIWSWLNVLSLLLNHPFCFIEKLKERGSADQAVRTQIDHVDNLDDGYETADTAASAENAKDDVVDLQEQPTLVSAMQKVMGVFLEAKVLVRIEDPSLSNKSLLIQCIVEEAVKLGEKTLLFSHSIPTLNYYESLIRQMKLGYKRIDGQSMSRVHDLTRQQHVEQFNTSDKYKVFLISTRAGGLGLNIQGATRVIINDFGFNPAWEEQAIGRAYRIGQKKPVFVYRFLTGGTFEELVHNKAIFKSQLFTRVVDKKNVISAANKSPGEFLFNPKEVPQQNFDECLGKDPQVLDRVLQRVDCVRNIVLTETFLKDDNIELTEQELKEANEELELEQLERDDPEEFARRMKVKKAQEAAESLRNMVEAARQNRDLNQHLQQSKFAPETRPPHVSHYFNPQVVYRPQQAGPTAPAQNLAGSTNLNPADATTFAVGYDDNFNSFVANLETRPRQQSLPPTAEVPRADTEASEKAPEPYDSTSAPVTTQHASGEADQNEENDKEGPNSAPGCRPQ